MIIANRVRIAYDGHRWIAYDIQTDQALFAVDTTEDVFALVGDILEALKIN